MAHCDVTGILKLPETKRHKIKANTGQTCWSMIHKLCIELAAHVPAGDMR